MIAAVLLIALLVALWAYHTPRHVSTPTVQPRVSRDELNRCAAIARRRLSEIA